jgi:hypothetical protein
MTKIVELNVTKARWDELTKHEVTLGRLQIRLKNILRKDHTVSTLRDEVAQALKVSLQ